MLRERIGGPTSTDGREQLGPLLRRAYPLGLQSFTGVMHPFNDDVSEAAQGPSAPGRGNQWGNDQRIVRSLS